MNAPQAVFKLFDRVAIKMPSSIEDICAHLNDKQIEELTPSHTRTVLRFRIVGFVWNIDHWLCYVRNIDREGEQRGSMVIFREDVLRLAPNEMFQVNMKITYGASAMVSAGTKEEAYKLVNAAFENLALSDEVTKAVEDMLDDAGLSYEDVSSWSDDLDVE